MVLFRSRRLGDGREVTQMGIISPTAVGKVKVREGERSVLASAIRLSISVARKRLAFDRSVADRIEDN